MRNFRDTFIYISQAPFKFLLFSIIIILFIIIIVIGNSLFNSAYHELKSQIKTLLPGSLLIKKHTPKTEILPFNKTTDIDSQILPQSESIREYILTQTAAETIVPYKLAWVQLDINNHGSYKIHMLCLHPDSFKKLKKRLIIEQGSFLTSEQTGIMVPQTLITQLQHTFATQFKIGDTLTLSNTNLGFGFSQYKLPIRAVYSLHQKISEFNFISSLILIDETSFNLLCNLPLSQKSINTSINDLEITDAQNIFDNRDTLFIQPDLSDNSHSHGFLFSLLGDPQHKYSTSQLQTQLWQGILVNMSGSSSQTLHTFKQDLSIYLSTQKIPAEITEWPAKDLWILKNLKSKSTLFFFCLIFFSFIIIASANITLYPTKKQLRFINTSSDQKNSLPIIRLFLAQASLQSILSGLMGSLTVGIFFTCIRGGVVKFSHNSIFNALFECQKLSLKIDISGFFYIAIFLLFYSLCSWIYPFFAFKK